jgi:hypothetical protein
MKKTILVAVFVLLLPGALCAREKVLYDIAEDMITLAEATIQCADPESSCAEADAIVLKTDAENGLRDIVKLVKSGNLASMQLSREQFLRLISRLESLNSQLAHIEMFDTACNAGIALISSAPGIILLGYYKFGFGLWAITTLDLTGIVLILEGIMLMILGVLAIPTGCLLLLACLFWWL